MTRVAWFVIAAALAAGASSALAAPTAPPGEWFRPGAEVHVDTAVSEPATAEAPEPLSRILWLNRCPNGCDFTKATTNDALSNLTQIGDVPIGTVMHVSPFALSEQVWTDYVACMREVYGPYNVQIVTEDPGPVPHHEAVVAGTAAEMHRPGALGVAPLDATTCVPKNNVISFSFANDHGPDPIGLCWTTSQESAHSYGLDHAFDCSDPMTYLGGCGQKYFRNKNINCGEFSARVCVCGSTTQNSHQKLLANFGPGVDPPPPTVAITMPADGATVPQGFSVFANATDRRGVAYAELYVNGWKWNTVNGAGPTFVLDLPQGVPDGVMEIKVRACNDLDVCAETPVRTVTRGAGCDDAATDCLVGQKCEGGRCFWDPPATEFGETCAYDQECVSGRCADGGRGAICTQECFGPPNDRCPEGFECSAPSGGTGVCRHASEEETGCCSTGGSSRSMALNLGLGAVVGLLALRRRRKS